MLGKPELGDNVPVQHIHTFLVHPKKNSAGVALVDARNLVSVKYSQNKMGLRWLERLPFL